MNHLPLLVVELPVPVDLEDAWNKWYHDEHIPDVLRTVDGAVRSSRYRLRDGDDTYVYLVLHEFESIEKLLAYQNSVIVAGRWDDYAARWGMPPHFRRRAYEPIFELDGTDVGRSA